MASRVDKICPKCGSHDIHWDGRGVWNVNTQEWEFEDCPWNSIQFWCGDCDGDIPGPKDVPLENES